MPFTSYFDVHEGHKVLTHSHLFQIPAIPAAIVNPEYTMVDRAVNSSTDQQKDWKKCQQIDNVDR